MGSLGKGAGVGVGGVAIGVRVGVGGVGEEEGEEEGSEIRASSVSIMVSWPHNPGPRFSSLGSEAPRPQASQAHHTELRTGSAACSGLGWSCVPYWCMVAW